MTVIKVDNAEARQLIELYTQLYCFPDEIRFIQDANGNWIMSKENLSNERYLNPDPQVLQQFLSDNNVLQAFNNIVDIVNVYGAEVEVTPSTAE